MTFTFSHNGMSEVVANHRWKKMMISESYKDRILTNRQEIEKGMNISFNCISFMQKYMKGSLYCKCQLKGKWRHLDKATAILLMHSRLMKKFWYCLAMQIFKGLKSILISLCSMKIKAFSPPVHSIPINAGHFIFHCQL